MFDEVHPDEVLAALVDRGGWCLRGMTPWWTFVRRNGCTGRRLDPAAVEALVLEGYARIVDSSEEPHLGAALVLRITEAGREYINAKLVERALRGL